MPWVEPFRLFVSLWVAFLASWFIAAFWRAPTTQRSLAWPVWVSRILVVAGFVLLNHRASAWLGARRMWHVGYHGADVLALLMVPGFAFCWWARLHLGRLWSANVVLKADHRVVQSGPYRFVRHPIYTGILCSMLMTALAEATWVALAGVAVTTLGFAIKAREEERFLSAELGPDAYAAYRRRVPMLVPFWPVRG
jgi:protein-S-isoprenylcysteine O-methyltransferase Ste14